MKQLTDYISDQRNEYDTEKYFLLHFNSLHSNSNVFSEDFTQHLNSMLNSCLQ